MLNACFQDDRCFVAKYWCSVDIRWPWYVPRVKLPNDLAYKYGTTPVISDSIVGSISHMHRPHWGPPRSCLKSTMLHDNYGLCLHRGKQTPIDFCMLYFDRTMRLHLSLLCDVSFLNQFHPSQPANMEGGTICAIYSSLYWPFLEKKIRGAVRGDSWNVILRFL